MTKMIARILHSMSFYSQEPFGLTSPLEPPSPAAGA